MNAAASLVFPVLAFTPNGVMPYSRYENLLRVMKNEYDMDWYKDLELVDSKGTCVVVRSACIAKESILAKMFGRMVEVEIRYADKVAEYDVESTRSRVFEFLSLYPGMYQSAGFYDELVKKLGKATTTDEIVSLFLE